MIDAATQILSAVKPSNNRSDRAADNKSNTVDSNASFTSVYKKSKSNLSEKPSNQSTPKNDNQKKSSSTENSKKPEKLAKQETNRSDEKQLKESEKTLKQDEVSNNGKVKESDETDLSENKEVVSDAKWAAVETIEEELLVETNPLILLDENIVDPETDATEINIELAGLSDDNSIAESKENVDVVAQSIIGEIKASIENVDKSEEREKPVQLTRSQLLENIKNILNKDLLGENRIPEQLLKPDMLVNLNATKILGEQLKAKDFNMNTKIDLTPEIELIPETEEISEIEESSDLLLQKLIEKLDLGKMKSEKDGAFKLANVVADKTSISDFVDQLSPKLTNESSGIGSISQTMGLSNRAGTTSPIQQFSMNTQLNQEQWGSEFSKRINFMVANDIKQAELRLDPPELGRINIKISINQDQASIVFSSAHGNVREAIESSMPRLRELLQESGIQLNDANVNEHQQEKPNNRDDNGQLAGPILPTLDEDAEIDETNRRELQHSADGLIDYFA